MSEQPAGLCLRGRRDEGNRVYRRIGQLQALEQRSGGAFKYVAYDRDRGLYQVRAGETTPLYLRSAEIDSFVAGVEYGLLALGALRAPSGKQAAQWYAQTIEEPVARVEPLHQLAEPEPTATARPVDQDAEGQPPAGELRVRWAAVPDADRYYVEVRNAALRALQWHAAAVTDEPICTVPVRTWSEQWQVRVRAANTAGVYADSEWAVTPATPADN